MYWGLDRPPGAIVGLFVPGLGIALLYPLTISFAIGAAGARSDTAIARAALAGSLALLVTPAFLGDFADKVGLHLAHLIVPGLVVVGGCAHLLRSWSSAAGAGYASSIRLKRLPASVVLGADALQGWYTLTEE